MRAATTYIYPAIFLTARDVVASVCVANDAMRLSTWLHMEVASAMVVWPPVVRWVIVQGFNCLGGVSDGV